MKTLIIYTHPDTVGYCPSILKTLENKLKTKNLDYEILDLYKSNYDAILHEDELYTSGNKNISEENKAIQEKITNSENLIFIFPLWWANVPAILKGFFDKVLVSGFGFKYSPNGMPIKLLKGKKAVVFTTSGGPKIYYLIKGNTLKKNIQKDILGFCGIKSKFCQLYNCPHFSESENKRIEKLVDGGLKYFN